MQMNQRVLIIIRKYLVAIVVLLLSSNSTADIERETRLFGLLGNLVSTNQNAIRTMSNSSEQLIEDYNFLSVRWNEYARGEVPDIYLDSLEMDIGLITQGIRTQNPVVFDDGAENIHVKRIHAESSDVGLGGVVNVDVKTLVGVNERSGYWVCHISKGLGEYESEFNRFSERSSPTNIVEFAPGRYFIWALGTDKASRSLITIGYGNTSQGVDIPVLNPNTDKTACTDPY